MICVDYTIECDKCEKQASAWYEADDSNFDDLETAKQFIDNVSFELVKVDGETRLLCAECASELRLRGWVG